MASGAAALTVTITTEEVTNIGVALMEYHTRGDDSWYQKLSKIK